MPGTTFSPTRTAMYVTTPLIGAVYVVFRRTSLRRFSIGLILRQSGARLAKLRAGLLGAGLRGRQRRHGAIVGGFSRIVILLGNQTFLEQYLPAIPVEFRMLQIRRARFDVRLRRYVVGFGGFYSRVG